MLDVTVSFLAEQYGLERQVREQSGSTAPMPLRLNATVTRRGAAFGETKRAAHTAVASCAANLATIRHRTLVSLPRTIGA